MYEDAIRSLQLDNEGLVSRASTLESSLKDYEYEILSYKRKIEEYEILVEK